MKIKGWLTDLKTASAYYEAVAQYEKEIGRRLTRAECGALMDVIGKKLPQEHLEALLQGKKVLVFGPNNAQSNTTV